MRRPVLRSLLLACLLSACTTESVMRPNVDIGAQTAALTPVQPVDDYTGRDADPDVMVGTPLAQETEDYALAAAAVHPQAPAVPDGPYHQDELIGQAPKPSLISAGMTRLGNPLGLGKQSSPLAMPADEAECRRELKRLGVTYRDLPPVNDSAACRIPTLSRFQAFPAAHG